MRDWAWVSADAPSWPLGELLGARQGPELFCAPADPAGDMGSNLALRSTVAAPSAAKFPPAACGARFRYVRIDGVVGIQFGRGMLGSVVSVCGCLTGVSRSGVDVTREPVIPWQQRRGAGRKCRCLWVKDNYSVPERESCLDGLPTCP